MHMFEGSKKQEKLQGVSVPLASQGSPSVMTKAYLFLP